MCDSPDPRILYVDNNQDTCHLIGLMFHHAIPAYGFTAVTNASKALAVMRDQPVALLILEYILPEMSGVELCRFIRQTDSRMPILFFSGMAREIDRNEAIKAGATEYLIKPNDLERLTETVKQLLDESQAI